MKIALLTSNDSALVFSDELSEFLKKKIANLRIVIERVPAALDLPAAAKDLSNQEMDLVVAAYTYCEEDYRLRVVAEKLVDVEINTPGKLFKIIEKTDIDEDCTESEKKTEKNKLAEKYGKKIVTMLFGKPKERSSDVKEFTSDESEYAEADSKKFGTWGKEEFESVIP